MYVVNKFVGWMISPVGLALVGLLVAYVCRLYQCCKVGRRLFVLSLVWLWVWATPTMSRIVGASLECPFLVDGRVPRIESYPNAEAILLLGGGVGCNTNLSDMAEMWTSADRVWMAARLWKAGKAPTVIASGGSVTNSTAGLLRDFGVPCGAVVFDEDPRNTEEEAKAAAKRGYREVLVVTSAWHMKRAMLMFKMFAPELEAVPVPADWENVMAAMQPWSLLELLPSPLALMWNSVTFHEWLGILGYRLFR